MSGWLLLCAVLAASPSPPAPAGRAKPVSERPKLAVTTVSVGAGIDPKVADGLSAAIVAEIARRGVFSPISSADIQALVGFERQRQMLGCSEQGSSCLSELAGAMGARFVMSGTLVKLGDAYQFTLQTLDSTTAQPLGRSVGIANDLNAVRAQIPTAVAEATATPLPPPPSRVLPYSLMGGGGLVLLGGGVVGLIALTTERSLGLELERGTVDRQALQPYGTYLSDAQFASAMKTSALAGMLLGAGAIAAGLLLMPSETASPGGPKLSFAFGARSLGVAGSF